MDQKPSFYMLYFIIGILIGGGLALMLNFIGQPTQVPQAEERETNFLTTTGCPDCPELVYIKLGGKRK